MSELLGQAVQLPENDADYGYVSSVASRNVEDVINEENSTKPKPVFKTSSFITTIGASLAGMLVLILVNKGVIGSNQGSEATMFLTPAVTLAIGWIIGKFVEARGKVSVEKVRATQQLQQAKLTLEYERQQNKKTI
jgi:hypothetical protein